MATLQKRVYLLMVVMISKIQLPPESFPFYYQNYHRRTLNSINADFHSLPNLKAVRKRELRG